MAARPVASGSGHRTCEERRGVVVRTCMHDGGPTGHHRHGAFMGGQGAGRGRAGGGQGAGRGRAGGRQEVGRRKTGGRQGLGRGRQGAFIGDYIAINPSRPYQSAIRAQSACNQHVISM